MTDEIHVVRPIAEGGPNPAQGSSTDRRKTSARPAVAFAFPRYGITTEIWSVMASLMSPVFIKARADRDCLVYQRTCGSHAFRLITVSALCPPAVAATVCLTQCLFLSALSFPAQIRQSTMLASHDRRDLRVIPPILEWKPSPARPAAGSSKDCQHRAVALPFRDME